jgi:hypothetical protein
MSFVTRLLSKLECVEQRPHGHQTDGQANHTSEGVDTAKRGRIAYITLITKYSCNSLPYIICDGCSTFPRKEYGVEEFRADVRQHNNTALLQYQTFCHRILYSTVLPGNGSENSDRWSGS